jgi:glycosyltransferase involved in cell wall biosynthesis
MKFPLVTFLSPCYNHSKYIIESLDSIRNQTYPNIQHIIIDDCSTDDSASRIENWIAKHNYKSQFIRHEKNKGISYTLNESIKLAKGEYWTALATDDYIRHDRTERFVNYLEDRPETNMVTSDCMFVNEKSEEIILNGTNSFVNYYTKNREFFSLNKYGTYRSLLEGNYIPSSLMVRKKIFDQIGFFNTNLVMEDWEMWLRVSRIAPIAYLPEQLTYYRFHTSNTSYDSASMSKGQIITFLQQYKYCKKMGLANEFKFLHKKNLVFSPIKEPFLTALFLKHSPKSLYISNFIRKSKDAISKKFLKKKLS